MTNLLVSTGRTASRGLRAILLASVVVLALGTVLAPAALAATPTHGLIWSCSSAPQPELDQMASKALEAKIAVHHTRRVASFSECLFLSKQGTFLLWDIASTKMLTDHAGHSVTAQNEFDFLNRTGHFPRRLQFIGRDHTQFLIAGAWADASNTMSLASRRLGITTKSTAASRRSRSRSSGYRHSPTL